MYRFFLRKSAEPHSTIFARSITYRTKSGNYLDADTRKQVSQLFMLKPFLTGNPTQFFYNENGDPSFVIVIIDRVRI